MTQTEPPAPEAETAPLPPRAAHVLFGDRIGTAAAYADLLAGDGVAHGHIGPREVGRLWSRHLVNSALLADLLPDGARFADVGSGAGLPGVPMVIRRPDLSAMLVDPMLRRTNFLTRVVSELALDGQVDVVRGRADDGNVRTAVSGLDWVVARAVAPLDRLVRWCLPLLAPGGRLLALKGESAQAELHEHRAAVARLGGGSIEVIELGVDTDDADGGVGVDPTWVVSIERRTGPARKAKGRR